jgi:ankyrin repeat protein
VLFALFLAWAPIPVQADPSDKSYVGTWIDPTGTMKLSMTSNSYEQMYYADGSTKTIVGVDKGDVTQIEDGIILFTLEQKYDLSKSTWTDSRNDPGNRHQTYKNKDLYGVLAKWAYVNNSIQFNFGVIGPNGAIYYVAQKSYAFLSKSTEMDIQQELNVAKTASPGAPQVVDKTGSSGQEPSRPAPSPAAAPPNSSNKQPDSAQLAPLVPASQQNNLSSMMAAPAIMKGDVAAVKQALASGVNPNLPIALLPVAVGADNPNTIAAISLLLDAGAKVSDRDSGEQTPIYDVLNPDIADTLIKAGAKVNDYDSQKGTPLMSAVGRGGEGEQ